MYGEVTVREEVLVLALRPHHRNHDRGRRSLGWVCSSTCLGSVWLMEGAGVFCLTVACLL